MYMPKCVLDNPVMTLLLWKHGEEFALPLWFRLEKGTTYNSFLIFGEKTALVDASHEKFRGLYMDTLKEQLKAAGRSLDYIMVSHTEPDHSGMFHSIFSLYF